MDTLVNVTFREPVKTARGWHKPGDTIAIPVDEARHLDAAGLVSDVTMPDAVVMEDFQEAVARKAQELAEAMADQLVGRAMVETVVPLEAEIAHLKAENAALKDAASAKPAPKPKPDSKG